MQLDMNWKNLIQFFKVYSLKKIGKNLKSIGEKIYVAGIHPPPPLNPNLAEVLKIHCSAHEGWGDISFRAWGIKLDV